MLPDFSVGVLSCKALGARAATNGGCAGALVLSRQRLLLRRAQKRQQFVVDFSGVSPGYAMRPVLDYHKSRSFNHFGGSMSGRSKRHDSVCIAMDDQCGHVHPSNILAK